MKMFLKFVVLVFCAALSIPATYAATDKVLCYYASWAAYRPGNGKFTPEDIQAEYCTHIFYAFVGLNLNGSVAVDEKFDINQGGFQRVADLKKRNPKLKLLFSVGGAAAGTYPFSVVSGTASLRNKFANNAVELIQKYNFDGFDIDWEYPWSNENEDYIALLTSLREAFKPHGYLLTVAVAANPSEVWGGYNITAMSEILDWINVMTYDFYGDVGYTVQTSPLYPSSLESPWQKDFRNANASIHAWLAGGLPPEKVAIGAVFYGHAFTLADPKNGSLHAKTIGRYPGGPYTQNTGTLGYAEVCEFHKNGTRTWDDEQKAPFVHDGDMWIGFDDEKSLAAKVEYAKKHNLAGIFVWSIETDDLHGFCGEKNSLLKSIHDAMSK